MPRSKSQIIYNTQLKLENAEKEWKTKNEYNK